MFEKEGNAKIDEVYMTNLVAVNLSYLSLRKGERVKASRKDSQALCSHSANGFKAVICMNLMHDNEVATKDATLA